MFKKEWVYKKGSTILIDTHIHLDNKAYFDDIDDVIKNALNLGVKKFIIPGADINDLPRAIELSEKYAEVFFAVGIHPYDIDSYDEKYLEKFINHKKCVANGECGLNYFRLPEDEDEKNSKYKTSKRSFYLSNKVSKKIQKTTYYTY